LTEKEFKKHHYNPWHKKRLLEILEEEKTKLQYFLREEFQPNDVIYDPRNFFCWFCDFRPKTPQENPAQMPSLDIVAVWKHLASKTHKENLKQFWEEMRLEWKLQTNYRMNKGLLNKKIKELETLKNGTTSSFSASEIGDPNHCFSPFVERTSQPRTDVFDDRGESLFDNGTGQKSHSNNNPFPSAQATLSLDIPEVVKEVSATATTNTDTKSNKRVKEPKTLISKNGILQNPTGFHNGERVWGGGIIKVKPEDWIPWPIDLDDENDQYEEGKSYLGEVPTTSFYLKSKSDNGTITNEGEIKVKRTIGYAPNLTRIEVQQLLPDGNIHSGAKPPWLCDDVDNITSTLTTTKATNTTPERPVPSVDLSFLRTSKKKEKNPNRVGADWVRYVQQQQQGGRSAQDNEKTSSEAIDDMWLPKFGRVWNEGPRIASRREFLLEQKIQHDARANYQKTIQNLEQNKHSR
jgi:hypothetical protein